MTDRYTAEPEVDPEVRAARLLKAVSAPNVHRDATFVLDLIASAHPIATGWNELWPAYRSRFGTPDSTAQYAVWSALDVLEQARLACIVDHGLPTETVVLGCPVPSPDPVGVRVERISPRFRDGSWSLDRELVKSEVCRELGITGGALVAAFESMRARGELETVKRDKWKWRLTDKGRRAYAPAP